MARNVAKVLSAASDCEIVDDKDNKINKCKKKNFKKYKIPTRV